MHEPAQSESPPNLRYGPIRVTPPRSPPLAPYRLDGTAGTSSSRAPRGMGGAEGGGWVGGWGAAALRCRPPLCAAGRRCATRVAQRGVGAPAARDGEQGKAERPAGGSAAALVAALAWLPGTPLERLGRSRLARGGQRGPAGRSACSRPRRASPAAAGCRGGGGREREKGREMKGGRERKREREGERERERERERDTQARVTVAASPLPVWPRSRARARTMHTSIRVAPSESPPSESPIDCMRPGMRRLSRGGVTCPCRRASPWPAPASRPCPHPQTRTHTHPFTPVPAQTHRGGLGGEVLLSTHKLAPSPPPSRAHARQRAGQGGGVTG